MIVRHRLFSPYCGHYIIFHADTSGLPRAPNATAPPMKKRLEMPQCRDPRLGVAAHTLARRPLATSLREATCGRVIASGCLRQCTLRSEASAVHDATSPSSNRTCGFPAYGFPLSAFPVVMAFFLSWAVERILYDFFFPVNPVSALLTLPSSCPPTRGGRGRSASFHRSRCLRTSAGSTAGSSC